MVVLSYATFIEADGKLLTLANIYAPNKDDPNFFDTFFDRLSCLKNSRK